MKNLSDAYQEYIKQNSDQKGLIANLNTAFIKYTLPELGFVISERSAKRLHPNDIKLAIQFASQFSIKESTSIDLLKAQEKCLKKLKVSKTNLRHQKMYLNKFIQFISEYENEFISLNKNREYKKLKRFVSDFSIVEESKFKSKRKSSIALSLNSNDYKGDSNSIKKELIRINLELENFVKYLNNRLVSKYTIESYYSNIKRLLGWYYLQHPSLAEISLTKLIPVCNIYPQINNHINSNQYFLNKYKLEQEAKNQSKQTIKFLEDFFITYNVKTKEAKIGYITALINLAKYLYYDITDADEYQNYGDISVIRKLRVYSNNLPNNPKKVEIPLPSWEVIIKCLKETKERADITKGKSGNRLKAGIARDLQNFLILGMFTLIPPLRQRVIRELRIGETFKHGDFINNIFVPKNKLSNPEEAKYWLHLQPEDYKTGKKYGEWYADFPNVQFSDGTNFYQYLDKWIYGGYRNIVLKNEKHNYLFMQNRSSKPMNVTNMGDKLNCLFLSLIKQQISPHKLRTIYRTYLEDLGVSQPVLNSSAFWMQHSPEEAKGTYTKQSIENKLKPGKQAIMDINSELLKD